MLKLYKIIKIIAALLIGTIIGLVSFFVIGQALIPNFYKPYIVLSGSMEPIIPTGSVIFSKSSPDYQVGDVITFDQGKGDMVTHRISKLENGLVYTKGDANEEADAGTISSSQIMGKLAFTIPLLGYLIDFGKTPQGFILLVIIPATIIVYEEARSVKIEVTRMLKKKRMENNNQTDQPLSTPPAPSQKRGIPKAYALIPILGCAFLIVAATGAYFTDREISTKNQMGAASSFGEEASTDTQRVLGQQAEEQTKLVINEYYNPTDTQMQWVEIYNPGPATVDMSNYSIRDGVNCDGFLGGTLEAGGHAVVSPLSKTEFETIWGPNSGSHLPLSTSIGNGLDTGDTLVLSSTSCTTDASPVDQATIAQFVENQSMTRVNETDFVLTNPTPGQ